MTWKKNLAFFGIVLVVVAIAALCNLETTHGQSFAFGPITATTVTATTSITNSGNGAASAPAATMSGAPYTGGTGTTTFPLFYINGGTAPTTWSTAGTVFGVNAPSGYTGNIFDMRLNGGSSQMSLTQNGVLTVSSQLSSAGSVKGATYQTAANCTGVGTAANPSVASCTSAAAGTFSCATNASGGTCQVNTTAVTANSIIIVQEDDSLGTKLSVTCNTNNVLPATAPLLGLRSAATSFTINVGTFTTNPLCFSYFIVD